MVHFSPEDHARVRDTYEKWWRGELNRPIVPITTSGHGDVSNPGPEMVYAAAWDFSISPKELIDAHDRRLSGLRFYGEAFPAFKTEALGPGTMAAFLGCTPLDRRDTVWFEPPRKDIPIEELHFEPGRETKYLRRVMDIYEAAMEKWRGSVVVGMVDMGGILDVLSSFRGAENLLMDLYDAPDEVLRCVNELQKCWFYYYDLFNSMMDGAAGYTQWFPLYYDRPGYILQSDFSYMISPDMFDVFVAPELKSSAERMNRAVYHLDGPGEIPHLDSILKIDAIKGIQWVPGAGAPENMDWDDLLKKILSSGKKLISRAQTADGFPIPIAENPGQLYFDERRFHKDDPFAKEYAARYGINL